MPWKVFFAIVFAFLGSISVIKSEPARAEESRTQGIFVSSQGSRLWVETEGKGEPPILLIAGGPGLAHDYFQPYFSRLAAHHRVIYYDAVGRGRSDSASTYSVARDVKDIENLRKSLGVQSWSLLGHSYGGMVALAYALEHPKEVHRLILADTHWSGADWQASNNALNARIQKERPEIWKNIQQLRARGLHSAGQEYQVPASFYFYKVENSEAVGVKLSLNPVVYHAIAGNDADFVLGPALAGLDFRRSMKSLSMPVLVLGGRHDQIVPAAETLAVKSYLPKAHLVFFEQSGHFPFIEETEKSVFVIDRFLRGAAR